MVLTIHVPMLPPTECSPNSREHWSRRIAPKHIYQLLIQTAINRQWSRRDGRFERAWIDLEFVFPVRRRRDKDNLIAGFKSGLDAIKRTGLIVDDDSEHVKLGDPTVTVNKARAPETVITIRDWEQRDRETWERILE